MFACAREASSNLRKSCMHTFERCRNDSEEIIENKKIRLRSQKWTSIALGRLIANGVDAAEMKIVCGESSARR